MYICLLLVFFLPATPLFSQHWSWADKIGLNGSGNDYGQDIKLDPQGNVYVCGRVKNASTFGWASTPVTPAVYGDQDLFIAKYSNNGALLWAKRNGGASHDYANGMVVDSYGNLYVTGYFSGGSMTFEGTTYSSTGASEMYIAKFNAAGTLIWIKYSTGSNAFTNGITLYNDTTIYITGEFNATLTFGSSAVTSAGSTDGFITRLDSAGNVQWLKRAGGPGLEKSMSVTCDSSGNAYICGEFSTTASFDAISVTTGTVHRDAFVAKYTWAGNAVWVKRIASSQLDRANKIAYDPAGYVVVTGNTRANTTFVDPFPQTFVNSGAEDIFLAKYNLNGNLQWGKGWGGTGFEQGGSLCINAQSEIFLTGELSSAFTFGTIPVTPIGARDLFYSKFSPSGNIQWLKLVDGHPSSGYFPMNNASCLDSDDYLYVTGGFKYTSTFGDYPLTAAGTSEDVFLAKMSPQLEAAIEISDTLLCIYDTALMSFTGAASITGHAWVVSGAGSLLNAGDSLYASSFVAGTHSYSLTVTDGYDTLTVEGPALLHVATAPEVNLGNDTTLCAGQSLLIDAGSGHDTYTWAGLPDMTSGIVVNSAGTYAVTVTDGQCQAWDSITLYYDNIVALELGNDTTLCTGQSILVTAPAGYDTYEWHTGESAQQINVNSAGIYVLNVSSGVCSTSDSIGIYFDPGFVFDLGNDTTLCPGIQLELFAMAGGDEYIWSNSSTTQNIVIETAGSYWVNVKQGACEQSDTITISYLPDVTVSLGNDTTVCDSDNFLLATAQPFETYLWNTGDTVAVLPINSTGMYSVQVTDANGCSYDSEPVQIQVDICLGVRDELAQADIHVYPNPAVGFVNLTAGIVPVKIVLQDVSGRIIHTENPTGKLTRLELAGYPKGAYFITGVFENGVSRTFTLMIE